MEEYKNYNPPQLAFHARKGNGRFWPVIKFIDGQNFVSPSWRYTGASPSD